MMKIRLLPVFSRLAEEDDVPSALQARLPQGLRLSRHQVDTYRALTESDAEVVFNTAMTGDGKSLAGQLPALVAQNGWKYPFLALYPTNELIEDQMAHLESVLQRWDANIEYSPLNSAELDLKMQDEDYLRRGDALMSVLRNGDFILSNPDIFHYVMHQFYTWPEDAPDRYAGPLTQKFKQFIFDEFHIFDAPQIVSVLNALLFMRETGASVRSHKFLFLSATPKKLMQTYLKQSGLKVQFIEGEYASSGNPQAWRKILNPVEIHFEPTPRAEAWLDAHLDDILLPFFVQRHPHAKGAIIVNSRAAALRIYEKLQPVFVQHGLKVAQNTGWTGRTRRRASYTADLLVGTSTVDVGVDFQINFLVFESDSAGTFLQRLGRLGRHDYHTRNGQDIPFQDFVAYALLPEWIVESLFQGKNGAPPLLEENAEIERMTFNEAVEQAFPTPSEFEQYAQMWGKFQSVKILWGMARKPVWEQYKETRASLQARYEATFGVHLKSAWGEYQHLQKEQPALLEEALSFRGSTLFPCCVIDESESGTEQFKVVDLLSAVANHTLDYLMPDDFYAAVRKAGLNPNWFKKQEPLGFFRLGAPRDFQRFVFHFHDDMSSWGSEQFGKAIARAGFSLDADFPGQAEINRRLRRRTLPALFCAGKKPSELKRRLNLPLLFPLYEFESDDGISGTLALGRAALLLDARLRFHPLDCGGGAIFI
jgi:CRISPR-associated endonuclease/helicase Cas3